MSHGITVAPKTHLSIRPTPRLLCDIKAIYCNIFILFWKDFLSAYMRLPCMQERSLPRSQLKYCIAYHNKKRKDLTCLLAQMANAIIIIIIIINIINIIIIIIISHAC